MKALVKNNKLLRKVIFFVIIIPGIPFILGSLGYVIYAFWPWDISNITNIKIVPSAGHISISAHGVNDSPASWSDDLQLAISKKTNQSQQSISLDWRPFSNNPLICSVIAKRIGKVIGEKIAQTDSVKSIHAIGHSCGAFVVFGLCEGVKASGRDIKIQTTYLDPVSVYAGFFWQYGVNNFGSCAGFSDAYIDTGDTVPGSNQTLHNAHTFDVTQVRLDHHSGEIPHNWPTIYYKDAYINDLVPLYINFGDKLNTMYPRGKLSVINSKN